MWMFSNGLSMGLLLFVSVRSAASATILPASCAGLVVVLLTAIRWRFIQLVVFCDGLRARFVGGVGWCRYDDYVDNVRLTDCTHTLR